jgi:hypothetical protein
MVSWIKIHLVQNRDKQLADVNTVMNTVFLQGAQNSVTSYFS